jgi:plasmid rolling circle replication initiator protein Rep
LILLGATRFVVYSEDSQILIDLTDFEKYKKLTIETANLLKKDDFLHERGETIEHCGDILQFDNEAKLLSANFCRQRLCPNCQRRKALKTYSKFKRISEELQKQGFAFLHLVLTIKNCEDYELNETISKLFNASSRLFKKQDCKRVFKGVLRCLEVSYSKNDCSFHPHLHCLIAVRKSYFTSRYYLKIEKIRELWQEVLKVDYLPQVWASRCDENAIAEVAKYSVKPLELDLTDAVKIIVLKHLFCSLHGRRLLQTYGVIKTTAKALKIDLNEDELESDATATSIYSFVYNYKIGKYERSEFEQK